MTCLCHMIAFTLKTTRLSPNTKQRLISNQLLHHIKFKNVCMANVAKFYLCPRTKSGSLQGKFCFKKTICNLSFCCSFSLKPFSCRFCRHAGTPGSPDCCTGVSWDAGCQEKSGSQEAPCSQTNVKQQRPSIRFGSDNLPQDP